jgi:hypothetical protein
MLNMMKKALALLLAIGFALATMPVAAQDFGPNTIWGEVPQGVTSAANAVLQDASGRVIATAPVVGGKFAFRDVAPGQYAVVVQDGAGRALATSEGISQASGAVNKALFGASRVPAAAVTSGGGGLGTTGWILIGAAAAGITTAVIIASNDDEGAASASR